MEREEIRDLWWVNDLTRREEDEEEGKDEEEELDVLASSVLPVPGGATVDTSNSATWTVYKKRRLRKNEIDCNLFYCTARI